MRNHFQRKLMASGVPILLEVSYRDFWLDFFSLHFNAPYTEISVSFVNKVWGLVIFQFELCSRFPLLLQKVFSKN